MSDREKRLRQAKRLYEQLEEERRENAREVVEKFYSKRNKK